MREISELQELLKDVTPTDSVACVVMDTGTIDGEMHAKVLIGPQGDQTYCSVRLDRLTAVGADKPGSKFRIETYDFLGAKVTLFRYEGIATELLAG